ncbi:soluble lytic murein transglycosylase [Ruminiclostridium sufflavum DSM 19573]|uniref:Soluble lytic murein transglycosylase n=1 Tax=Ruminiclostridium sufflavum DSM 19573 TaxID=1121337 RepID=A0A318XNR4_9FIRM|nr:lytic transglycosylase domain-containing protein [Ruminiclostridium sufflavum]PYG89795.1 soluble lytic murein transglycosylase [Ruminiclostridium sufflavum DSM 19573]
MKRKSRSRYKGLLIFLVFILAVVFAVNSIGYILKYMYPIKYSQYVERYSDEYGLDRNLVYSIIKAESGFNPNAVSVRNAKGLMQIMDSTGEWAAEKMNIENFESGMLLEPETNIRIGCWYIARLLNQYDSNVELALTAYNAGSGNVSKWLKNTDISSNGKTLDRIPFEETENYVKKIKRYNYVYKKLYDGQK